jgi:hypothetical protein
MPQDDQQLRDPVECVIKVDDEETTALYPYLKEAVITLSRTSAGTGQLTFESIRREDGTWSVQDAGLFAPWKPIQIEARFGSYSEEIMRGYIKTVNAEYPQQMGAATVTVVFQDESILLDREHIKRTWSTEQEPMTDGEIAQQVAGDNGLNADTRDGQTNAGLNSDGTCIKLLQDRAQVNGFEFYVRESTLHFKPPELEGAPQPTIMVYAGDASNCANFSVRYDGHTPDEITIIRAAEVGTDIEEHTVSANLPLLGEIAADSTRQGLSSFVWSMPQPAGATLAEAQARAQAKANELAWKIIATGELDGALYEHVLYTHQTVNVDGVGDYYGGTYYVDEVQHRFAGEGYLLKFKLLKNAVGQGPQGGDADPIAAVR